ncbi:M23 family metallopeptidase [Paenibacillus marinisediminis]
MKRRWWSDSLTLLVIRDPERAVRQVSVPKILIVSVPIAALLSLSGLILSMQLKSASEIRDLEGKLSSQSLALDITVKDKDKAIHLLQNEIIRLSAEAETVKSKVSEMSGLESQLEQFIHTYLGQDGTEPITSLSNDGWNNVSNVGGEAIGVTNEQLISLAQKSSYELETVHDMLRSMEASMPVTLNEARNAQTLIAGTPSIWPTTSRLITSSFGYRQDPITKRAAFHAGIDIGGEVGDPVYAAADGKVVTAEFNASRGNYIVIRHASGLDTWYMHLSKIVVKEGQEVTKGDLIGKVGTSGRSTGAHLHFEVIQDGKTINPLPYMKAERTPAQEKIRS